MSLVLTIALLFTSCAAGLYGGMTSSTALSEDNFSYVNKNLRGKAQATYVLGIGGLSRQAIVNEAKQDMLKEHPLQDGQALANVTVDFKHSNFLGLVATTACYVTADIVEFR